MFLCNDCFSYVVDFSKCPQRKLDKSQCPTKESNKLGEECWTYWKEGCRCRQSRSVQLIIVEQQLGKYSDWHVGPAAGSKRKSTDTAPESAKKQKTDAHEAPSTCTDSRNASAAAPSAPKDIYGIELDGQWCDNVPVHESCDQVSLTPTQRIRSIFTTLSHCYRVCSRPRSRQQC